MSEHHHTKAWRRLRRRVLTRDRHQCQDCKRQGLQRLNVHHVLPLSKGGDDDLDNLAVLCPDCHLTRHASVEKNPVSRHAWADLLYQGIQ